MFTVQQYPVESELTFALTLPKGSVVVDLIMVGGEPHVIVLQKINQTDYINKCFVIHTTEELVEETEQYVGHFKRGVSDYYLFVVEQENDKNKPLENWC